MQNERLKILLNRVANGNHNAFTELYNLTHYSMYLEAKKILSNKQLAEEAVQEAFLQIWQNAQKYTPGKATVFTWMKQIVRYRSLDHLRYKNVRKEEALNYSNMPSTVEMCDSSAQEDKLLVCCIKDLQSNHCIAIKLVYFSGLSHSEASKHMNEPLGTIKSWVSRSLVKIRHSMLECA